MREALSQAIEDFQGSREYKEEILENSFTSYYVGYEDGQDAVKKLYPNLDLSSIISPGSKKGDVEEVAAPTPDGTPTVPVDRAANSVSEQRNRDGDED